MMLSGTGERWSRTTSITLHPVSNRGSDHSDATLQWWGEDLNLPLCLTTRF